MPQNKVRLFTIPVFTNKFYEFFGAGSLLDASTSSQHFPNDGSETAQARQILQVRVHSCSRSQYQSNGAET